METAEKEEQEKWGEKAKKEIDDWYNRYNEQLEKVKNENRYVWKYFEMHIKMYEINSGMENGLKS